MSMTLQDIFDHLTYGELSQLAVGGIDNTDDAGNADPGIVEDDRKQIIQHCQLGLIALYKRFRLKDKRVTVRLSDERNSYVLKSDYATTNTQSGAIDKYLIDTTEDPFDDTLMKIEEITAYSFIDNLKDKCEKVIPVNKKSDKHAIQMPSLNLLMVPDEFDMEHQPTHLEICYRASHPKLDIFLGAAAPIAVEIELPSNFTQALLFFIASRIMNPVGMVQEFHSGNSYYAKYEAECQRLEMQNYQQDSNDDNDHWKNNGFY